MKKINLTSSNAGDRAACARPATFHLQKYGYFFLTKAQEKKPFHCLQGHTLGFTYMSQCNMRNDQDGMIFNNDNLSSFNNQKVFYFFLYFMQMLTMVQLGAILTKKQLGKQKIEGWTFEDNMDAETDLK